MFEEMFQPAGDAVAPGLVADVAALRAHEFLDGGHGVVRRGDAGGVLAGEHGEVVQVIAGGEGVVAVNTELAADFAEGGAFVVVGVAEAGIDIVTDEGEVRDLSHVVVEERLDGVGVLVAFGDEAEGRVVVFVEGGAEAVTDPFHQVGHVGLHAGEDFLVGLIAAVVPHGAGEVLRVLMAVNLALDGDEEVGADVEAGAGDAFHDAGEVAAGVDDPVGTLALEVADEGLEIEGHGRVFKVGVEGAVEIGGDESDGAGHVSCALWVWRLRGSKNPVIPAFVKSIMPESQEQYDDAMFDFSQGRYTEVIARLRVLLGAEPEHFEAQLALGMAHYRQGDYAAAIAEGHKAEKLRPKEQLVHTNLSLFYMKAGDKTTAEHHGLQARIAGWRENMAAPGAESVGDPELQMAKPAAPPPRPPPPPRDMPWKKKPPITPAPDQPVEPPK